MPVTRSLVLFSVAAAVVAWAFLLRPTFLGGPATYVIVSGSSMEPTLYGGDLALVRRQTEYAIGDVVAFSVPEGEPGSGAIVIHRIAGGSEEDGYLMQGDNKDSQDPWRPRSEDILGQMWFQVPKAGRLIDALRAPLLLSLAATILSVYLILDPPIWPMRPAGDKRRLTSDGARQVDGL